VTSTDNERTEAPDDGIEEHPDPVRLLLPRLAGSSYGCVRTQTRNPGQDSASARSQFVSASNAEPRPSDLPAQQPTVQSRRDTSLAAASTRAHVPLFVSGLCSAAGRDRGGRLEPRMPRSFWFLATAPPRPPHGSRRRAAESAKNAAEPRSGHGARTRNHGPGRAHAHQPYRPARAATCLTRVGVAGAGESDLESAASSRCQPAAVRTRRVPQCPGRSGTRRRACRQGTMPLPGAPRAAKWRPVRG